MGFFIRFAAVFAIAVLTTTTADAQWQRLFTPVGGNYVRTNTIVEMGPYLLAGTIAGGVFRTTDPTQIDPWVQVGEGFDAFYVLGLTVADERTVFAVTQTGLRMSTDTGSTWSTPSWAPTNASVDVFTVIDGVWYMSGYFLGAHRSTDQGVTWTDMTNENGQCLFTRNGHYRLSLQGALYRTTDNGVTWPLVNAVAPFGAGANLFCAENGDLYASMNVQAGPRVFRSSDGGATFTDITNGLTKLVVGFVEVTGAIVVATDGLGFQRTTDHGATWTPVNEGYSGTPCNSLNIVRGQLMSGAMDGNIWGRPFDQVAVSVQDDAAERITTSGKVSIPWTSVRTNAERIIDVYSVTGLLLDTHVIPAGTTTLHTPSAGVYRLRTTESTP